MLGLFFCKLLLESFMNYFKIQILCLLLTGSFYLTPLAQTNIVQNNAATPTASNFAYPQSVFVDSHSGHIWVTDFDNNRVLRFDVSTLTGIDESNATPVLTNYFLGQNYPNPFNPSTRIQYAIRSTQFVTLKVYDVLGKEVVTLVNEDKSAGNYEVEFNISVIKNQASSGIYFYQIKAGDFIQTKKMALIK